VAPTPAANPDASRRCGERSATQMSAPAATGRIKRPIEKPVTKLKVIKNPARLHARNHHHPRPPGLPCRLQARAAATKTSSGQARITSSLNVTPLKENGPDGRPLGNEEGCVLRRRRSSWRRRRVCRPLIRLVAHLLFPAALPSPPGATTVLPGALARAFLGASVAYGGVRIFCSSRESCEGVRTLARPGSSFPS
jgi:hypothetical protein